MKNCNILGVRAKIRFLRGGGSQKKNKIPISRGGLPRKWGGCSGNLQT